ncbi:MAG: T9SS type A sorting domain-containing protein [Bacteroidia bacterium]|nr:T9SS type A sorting domain-containing protein [Bacteroidia bacterium]
MRNYFVFVVLVIISVLVGPEVFAQGKRFYAYYEGQWTDPTNWTLNSSGNIPDNPTNAYPGDPDRVGSDQDEVVIGTGKKINLDKTIRIKNIDIRGTLSVDSDKKKLNDKGEWVLDDDVVKANPSALIVKGGELKGTDEGILEMRSLSFIWFEGEDGTKYYENNEPKTDASSLAYIRSHNKLYNIGNIVLVGNHYRDIPCTDKFGSITIKGDRFFSLSDFTVKRDLVIKSGSFFTIGSLTESAHVTVERDVLVEQGAVLMGTPQIKKYASMKDPNAAGYKEYWENTVGTITVKRNFDNLGNVVFSQVAPKVDVTFNVGDGEIVLGKYPEDGTVHNAEDFYTKGESYCYDLHRQNCKMKLIFSGEGDSRLAMTGNTDIYQLICDKAEGYSVEIESKSDVNSSLDDCSLLTGIRITGSNSNGYSTIDNIDPIYSTNAITRRQSLLQIWANVKTIDENQPVDKLPIYIKSGTLKLGSGVALNQVGPKLFIPSGAELAVNGGSMSLVNTANYNPYIDLQGSLSITSGSIILDGESKGIVATNSSTASRVVIKGGEVHTTRLTSEPNCKIVYKQDAGKLCFDVKSGADAGATFHRTSFAIAEGGEVHVTGGEILFEEAPDKDAINTMFIDLKSDFATADFSKSTMTFSTKGEHTVSLRNTILGNVTLEGDKSVDFQQPEGSNVIKIAGDLKLDDAVVMRTPVELELQGDLIAMGTSSFVGHFVNNENYTFIGRETFRGSLTNTGTWFMHQHTEKSGYVKDGNGYKYVTYYVCNGNGNNAHGSWMTVDWYDKTSSEQYTLYTNLICTGNKNTKIQTQNPIILSSLTLKKDVKDAKVTIDKNSYVSLGMPKSNNGHPGKGLQAIQGKLVGPVFFTAVDDGQEIYQGTNADLTGTYLNFAGGALGDADKGTIYLMSDVHARAAQFLNSRDRKCIVYLGEYNLKLNFVGDYIDGKNIIPRRNEKTQGYTEEDVFSYNRSFWTDGTVSAGGLSLRLVKRPSSQANVDGGNYYNVLYPIGYDEGYAPAKINTNFTFPEGGDKAYLNELVLADCFFTIIPVKTKHPAVPQGGDAIDVYWRTKVENLGSTPIESINQNADNDGYRCRLLFRLPSKDNKTVVAKFKPTTETVATAPLSKDDLQCATDKQKQDINSLAEWWNQSTNMSVRKAYIYQNNIWHDLTRRAWWLDCNPSEAAPYRDWGATLLEGYLEDDREKPWPILHTSNYSRNSRRTNDSWYGKMFPLPIDNCSNSFNIAFGAALIDGDWTSGNGLEGWKSYELYSEPADGGNVASWTNGNDWYYIDNTGAKKKGHAPGATDVVHIQTGHEVNYETAQGLKCNQLVVDGKLTLGEKVRNCDVHQISGDGTIVYYVDVSNKDDINTAQNWKDSWDVANKEANFLVPNNPNDGYDYTLFQKNPKATMVFLLTVTKANGAQANGDKVFSLPTWLGDYPNLRIEYEGKGRQDRHSADMSGVTTKEIVVNGNFEVTMVNFTIGTSANFKSFKVMGTTTFSEGSVFTASDDPAFDMHLRGDVKFEGEAQFVKRSGNLHLYGNITNDKGSSDKIVLKDQVYFEGTLDQSINGPFTIDNATQFNVNVPEKNTVFMKGAMDQKRVTITVGNKGNVTINTTDDICSTLRLNIEKGKFDFCPDVKQVGIQIAGDKGGVLRIPTGAGLAVNNATVCTDVSVSDGLDAYSILLDGILEIGDQVKGELTTKSKCTGKMGGIGYLSNAQIDMADNNATLSAAFISPYSDEGKIIFNVGEVCYVKLGGANGDVITRTTDKGILDIRGASSSLTAAANSVFDITATSMSSNVIPAIRITAEKTTLREGMTMNIDVPGEVVGLYSLPLQNVNIKENTTVKAMNMASWPLQIDGDLATKVGSTLDLNGYNLDLNGGWAHDGEFIAGPNTHFNNVDFVSSVNTKFNNLTTDGNVKISDRDQSGVVVWVGDKFVLNTGDVTMKLKSGSLIHDFVGVVVENVRANGALGSTVGEERSSNLLVCTGDIEIKYGTEVKSAADAAVDSPAGIFAYSTEEYTSLYCEGTLPVLRLSSERFIQSNKTQGYPICVNKELQLAGAIYNIGSNRLRIMNGAKIVNGMGDSTVDNFSKDNMIASNLSNTDHGVEVEFVSSDQALSLVLPLGATTKYTPAVLENMKMTVNVGASSEERTLRIAPNAFVFPGALDDQKDKVLQHFWTVFQGNGLSINNNNGGYMQFETLFSDVRPNSGDDEVTVDMINDQNDGTYGIAVLMKDDRKWIRKSNVDKPGVLSLKDENKTLVLKYPKLSELTNLSGYYMAALTKQELYVFEYTSKTSGYAWTDGHTDGVTPMQVTYTWEKKDQQDKVLESGSGTYDMYPGVATWDCIYLDIDGNLLYEYGKQYTKGDLQGCRINISKGTEIDVDKDYWHTISMNIDGDGTVDKANNGFLVLGESKQHNFSTLDGRGWLGISRPEMPAASYTSFISKGGGTLVYMGGTAAAPKDYTILTSDASVNNLIVTGVGKRVWRWPNQLAVQGEFVMGPEAGDNITLELSRQSVVRFGGDVQLGNGTMVENGEYVFNGSEKQTVKNTAGSSTPFRVFKLTIQNGAGVETKTHIKVGDEKDNVGATLNFVDGKLTVGDGGAVTVYDNQDKTITGYSSDRYVVGALSRNVGTGALSIFPIGNEGLYAPISLQASVSTSMWKATYCTDMISKGESDVNNVSVLPNNSYWKIDNNEGKLARVKLHYSKKVIQSEQALNSKTYTIVTKDMKGAAGKWSEMPSNSDASWNLESVDAHNGKQQDGVSARLVTFGQVKTENKAPGWRGTQSKDWFNKNNWSFKEVPGNNDDVVIPSGLKNYPVISGVTAAQVKSIVMESGATLTIDKGSLMVTNDIKVTTAGGLRIKHAPSRMSSIIANNILDANGDEYNTAWIHRYLEGGRLYYVGSAVYESPLLLTPTPSWDFAHIYKPNKDDAAPGDLYEVYPENKNTIGKYEIDAFTGTVAFSAWDKWEQIGKLYMKPTYEATIYGEGDDDKRKGYNGWYLMTNPYPAPITLQDINFGEGIEKAVHVRTFQGGEYVWATSTVAGAINGGSNEIAPHQAFFVKVTGNGDIKNFQIRKPSIVKTSTLKSATLGGISDEVVATFVLTSEIDGEENEREMLWRFGKGSFDVTEDDVHLYGGNSQEIGVYKNGEIMAVPSYPNVSEMREYIFPLYVKVNDETNRATIKMPYSVFRSEFVEMVLVDKELGVEQDLRSNFKYTFDCEPGKAYEDRFEIRITNALGNDVVEDDKDDDQGGTATGIEDVDSDDCGSIAIFKVEDEVLVTISEEIFDGEATIKIIDIKGVVVAQKKIVENSGKIQLPSVKGIYVVEVASGSAVEFRKIRR